MEPRFDPSPLPGYDPEMDLLVRYMLYGEPDSRVCRLARGVVYLIDTTGPMIIWNSEVRLSRSSIGVLDNRAFQFEGDEDMFGLRQRDLFENDVLLYPATALQFVRENFIMPAGEEPYPHPVDITEPEFESAAEMAVAFGQEWGDSIATESAGEIPQVMEQYYNDHEEE